MKKSLQLIFAVSAFFLHTHTFAQDIGQLQNIDVNALSDDQIEKYWSQVKEGGYTMAQLEVLAKAKGVSASKIADFKRRVNSLGAVQNFENNVAQQASKAEAIENYGLKDGQLVAKSTAAASLFGYDFFENSKISFTPSVNVAVPENYQIGPGDELMIDLWGASEVTYVATVNNSGSIKINGVGFIYVNGFTLENASKKIISKLKNKHAGIAAPENSYNKINTHVTVSKIRTVQVNIIGEVKTPGTYALNSLSTVLNALYVAGGPTKMGSFRAVQLIRANKTIATLDVYEYLIHGTQHGNLKLQDQDVLLVSPYKNLVSVEGAVKRVGIYELKKSETLADLISYFGGFTPKAYTNLLVIERLNGSQKEVREIAVKEAKDFVMQAGDKLVVQEILDRYQNKISIGGEVYRPGDFELFENMSLKELIAKAEGITPEAFLERGLLVRTHDDTQKENIPFSVAAILNGSENINLQAKDEVRIFNKEELREKRTLTITGAVNTPATIDFVEKLQIEDVIALSGGLTAAADPDVISVSRRLKDGSFVTLSAVYAVSSDKNLAINKGTPFYLQPYDIITVRNAKGYTSQKNVTISGEVKYEGPYSLKSKNERISDLIARAGGFTEFAYLKGAALLRKTNKDYANDILKNIANNEGADTDVTVLKQLEADTGEYKVGIDLELIMKNKGSEIDMFLRADDVLIIPRERQTVKVSGMVAKPSLIQFTKGQGLRKYIDKSGGFADTSKKSSIYVAYANGDIASVKKFLFFKWYPKLKPGATIFVPAKPLKEKMSTAEVLGITTSIATLGILIQNILQ